MALAVVQVANNEEVSGGSATTESVNITTSAGNLLVCFIREGGDTTSTATITDSAGQTWTQVSAGYSSIGTGKGGIWYQANSAAVTSVTATWNASEPYRDILVYEVSGAALNNPEDSSVNSFSSLGTSTTSGALTTTNANDILFFGAGAGAFMSSWTPGSGYTITNNNVAVGANGSNTLVAMQWQIVNATQSAVTTTMSFNTSGANVFNTFAAFKAASVSGANLLSCLGAGS